MYLPLNYIQYQMMCSWLKKGFDMFYEGLCGFIIHGEAVLIMYLLIVHLK